MDKTLLATGKPADFSFRDMASIDVQNFLKTVGLEGARFTRIGGLPERGTENKKFLTRSIWLNNNKLKSIKNMGEFVESILEYPAELGWIDFSFNFITEIDECILNYKELRIIYFHGNCISNLDEIFKLRQLKQLRSITFHGNPISNNPHYRHYVIAILPQIQNLDFTPIVKQEKMMPSPPELMRRLKEERSAKSNPKENK